MVVITGRLVAFSTDDERDEPYAKFYLSEIDYFIETTLETATLLDNLIAEKLRERGVEPDPDDYVQENCNGNDLCDIAYCRNFLEEQYDQLNMIKELAFLRQAKASGEIN